MVPPGGTEITILIVRDACDRAALLAKAKAAHRKADEPDPDASKASTPPHAGCLVVAQP